MNPIIGKGHPPPIQVQFNDCIEQPCDLLRGTNGTTTITFKAISDAATFKVKVRGSWFGIGVDHNLGDQGENPCKYLLQAGTCPLETGKEYIYQIIDLVKPNETKVSGVTLTYKLLDDKSHVITCFTLTANVVDRKGEVHDDEDYEEDDDDL